jgi:UDP-glucose 4-epimerase
VDYKSDEQLYQAMKGIDTLIHLAGPDAHAISKNPDSIIIEHLELTGRLVHAAEVNDVKKIIYFSTIHVYGKNLKGTITEATSPIPVHPFAKAHLEAESIIESQTKKVVSVIVRCSNSFGAPYFENEKCWKLVVNDLYRSAFQNGKLIINSSGQSYRNFIAVDDVARATHHLLELNNERRTHNIYNLASLNTIRIIDIARRIQKELKNKYEMDCPIEIKESKKNKIQFTKVNYSIKKIYKTGFSLSQKNNERSLLLEYCNYNYTSKNSKYVNIGCGAYPIQGWINYDFNKFIYFAKINMIRLLLKQFYFIPDDYKIFMDQVIKYDICFANAGEYIPEKDCSIDVLYSSHMLEHLDQSETDIFMKESKRVLVSGGVIRIIVPDFDILINDYSVNNNPQNFVDNSCLVGEKPKTLIKKLQYLIQGHGWHYCMYNKKTLIALFKKYDFNEIKIINPGETRIAVPNGLDLFAHGGYSLFLEAIK